MFSILYCTVQYCIHSTVCCAVALFCVRGIALPVMCDLCHFPCSQSYTVALLKEICRGSSMDGWYAPVETTILLCELYINSGAGCRPAPRLQFGAHCMSSPAVAALNI